MNSAFGGSRLNFVAEHPLLEMQNIGKTFPGVRALDGVSLTLYRGEVLALLGENGAGKSTLLKVLAGLIQPDHGEIHWRGRPMVKSSHEIAYLPQREEVDWNFPATVRGIVEMGRYPHVGWWKRFTKQDAAQVDQALEAMDLLDLQDRQVSALSGGQQQRAFLARALAQEAHVFLLDEPFTGLDADAEERLADLMRGLKKEGRLIIASHHDLATVARYFDWVILLNMRVVASGPTSEVFTAENLEKTYGGQLNLLNQAVSALQEIGK